LIFGADAQKTPEYKELKKSIMAAATDKFGGEAVELFKSGKINNPLRPCTSVEYNGYDVPDGMFAKFWSKNQPNVIDGNLVDVINKELVYAGCLGRVSFKPFAYDTSGNRGVGLGLDNAQVTDVTTPRIDGRKSADKQFGAVAGGGVAEKELEDDEMPF
tara:strand:+ start:2257 stop:2733 length:477 start_codon:yes stop_codon:yes gene_type:complete